jgi:hypothetical protein
MELVMDLTVVAVSVACGIIAAYWVFDNEIEAMDRRIKELERNQHPDILEKAIYDIERGEG